MKKVAVLLAVACGALALASEGRAGHRGNAITWGPVVAIEAPGCDAFTPVLAADGHHYTSYGDCRGLNGDLPRKVSMGFRADRRRPAGPGRAGPADPGPHRLRRP